MRRARLWRAGAMLAALLPLSACVTPAGSGAPAPAGAAAGATLLDSHLTGFAMAYCLRSLSAKNLPEPDARVIREQGDRWSQIVVEQSHGDFTAFFVIMPAIDAALAATAMAYVKVEETGGSAPAPVFYCDALLRQPGVQGAMAQARQRLAPAYAQQ